MNSKLRIPLCWKAVDGSRGDRAIVPAATAIGAVSSGPRGRAASASSSSTSSTSASASSTALPSASASATATASASTSAASAAEDSDPLAPAARTDAAADTPPSGTAVDARMVAPAPAAAPPSPAVLNATETARSGEPPASIRVTIEPMALRSSRSESAEPARPGTRAARAEPAGGPARADEISLPAATQPPAPAGRGDETAGGGQERFGEAAANAAAVAAPLPAAGAMPARFADQLHALLPPAAPAAPAHPTHTVALDRSPYDADFAPALGTQITLLARDGVQQARIELNPADLGPVLVQIALDGGGARVDFHAEVAATRQAIEASLPALAGSLREAGMTLTGGGVFQQSPGRPGQDDGSRNGQAASGGRDRRSGDGDDATAPGGRLRPIARRGLVDLVA